MERKLWMIPKNIRSIPPWKLIKILNLFNSASEDGKWDSKVKDMLEAKNLKRDYGSYDKNPGGDRTYKSQLICLGLLYEDEEKNLKLTKAGKDLVGGHKEPLLILQKMLLRIQYPSVYSIGHNVAISESVKVKPFLFLLQLMQELSYLTTEEIGVAVVYGHNHNLAFQTCINRIKKIREGASVDDVIVSEEDLYTRRTRNNTFEDKVEYVADDIPNIFENYLESARLIERLKENGRVVSRLTVQAKELLKDADINFIETSVKEIKKNPISFQRRLGAWDGKKDTSRKKAEPIKDPEELLIRNEFIEFLSEGIKEEDDFDKFKQRMFKLGLDSTKVKKIIAKLNSHNTSLYEDRFQYISTSGSKNSQEFEEAVVKLLRKIGFEAFHTGNFKRPEGAGGYADAYFSYKGVAYIFDAKASEFYSISHSDLTKACHTYINNWPELSQEHNLPKAKEAGLFCYIAGGYKSSGNLNQRLSEIEEKTGVSSSAIIAWDFYKYVQKNKNCSKEDFLTKVSNGGRQFLN